MKPLIQILRALLTLLWAAFLGLNLLLLTSPHTPPQALGYAAFTVPDDSLRPDLSAGDLAILDPGASPEPGQIILYQKSGAPALGRIVGVSEEQFIVQAGGSLDGSFLLDPAAAQGVLATYLPGFGAPAEFLRSPLGIGTIVLAGVVLILLPGLLLRTPAPRRASRGRHTAQH